MIIRLLSVPELSPNKFQPDNSCNWQRVPQPAHLDLASGCIKVDDDYWLIGWCRKMSPRLMYGREGQIGLMFWSEDTGNVWEHYPLFDDDDYEYAKFETKRGVLGVELKETP